jgi:hypothetical protein
LTKNNLRRKVFAEREAQQQLRMDRRALLGDFDYQMHPKPDSEAYGRFDRVPFGPQYRVVQFDAGVRHGE